MMFLGFVCLIVLGGIILFKINHHHKKKKFILQTQIEELNSDHNYLLNHKKSKQHEKLDKIDENFESSLLLFEEKELFLNPKVSLNDLVIELNSNRTIVSNYINRSRAKNFNQYINELRINYLLKRFVDEPTIKKYTIDALAEETGFNSRKTFSDAFLEHTGFRPSNYIKNNSL